MIRFESVRKEFGGAVAIDRLDLEVQHGEIYGLIGPNGAGKTTTIRMACGLLPPTEGRVLITDANMYEQPELAQQHIGYLSDNYALYEDLTAWEYLDYFANAYRMPVHQIPQRIKEVIQLVGLEIKEQELTKGLSRGMRQRLGLARAILHRPKLLLLDEPASGLDPKARIELRDLLLSLRAEGTAILISSHILTELEGFCTTIGIMERGTLIRSEAVSSLTKLEGNQRKIRIRWIGEARHAIERIIRTAEERGNMEWSEGQVLCKLEATDEQLADLHENLIRQGVRVVEFVEEKQTVQDVYMQLSQHEVM